MEGSFKTIPHYAIQIRRLNVSVLSNKSLVVRSVEACRLRLCNLNILYSNGVSN